MVGVSSNIFLDVALVIVVAAVAAFLLRLIKQPQILAYVLVGVLITPVFKIVTDTSVIESMSTIGIAFLLFIVGLEMNIKSLRSVALVSTLGGSIQVLTLFVLGYLISLLLGFLSLEAAYIGLMVAFSSTMVVMKLLADKRELHTLHGRLIIGILLMQDIIAIFALSVLTSINDFSLTIFGIALVKFLGIFVVAYVASKFIFPPIFRYAARNQELLLVSSLGVVFLYSLLFHYLNISIAIGAFVAGISLGNLSYRLEIIGRIKSLKDFFALLFFVALGMGITISVIKDMLLPLIVLLVLTLIIKPFIIMTICSIFKYTKKPSFLTANSLAQIGEFSLILATQGLLLGHISQELFSLTVIVTLLSITITPYYMKYSAWMYDLLKNPLSIFDIFTTEGLEYLPTEVKPEIVLCGHNRIGYSILDRLSNAKKKILVVDYNPEIISRMVENEFHCIYGDVTDEEIIERMNLKNIKFLISTVPVVEENLLLIRKARKVNKKARIFVTASQIEDALQLYKAGADYVILPHFLGGEHVSTLIDEVGSRKTSLKQERKTHIEHLQKRRELEHEHPVH